MHVWRLRLVLCALALFAGLADAQWQISSFNAANLNGHGAGNQALWCGSNSSSYVSAPGYGNGWDHSAYWKRTMVNPSVGQVVQLSFAFNYDLEHDYDYFMVEYDSAGTWHQVLRISGNNRNFDAPGVQYPTDVFAAPIVYLGGDYGGTGGNEIRIRLRVVSDGAWSDEDGLWDTQGAVQIDDVVIVWDDGGKAPNFEFYDFEGPHDWQLTASDDSLACAIEASPHQTIETDESLGFWFTAPTDFVIEGVQAPAELGSQQQVVQIVRVDGAPASFAHPRTTMDFQTLVHLTGQTPDAVIPIPGGLAIQAGDQIGVLGGTSPDGVITRSSATSYRPGPYRSAVGPFKMTLYGLRSDESIAATPAGEISSAIYGPMGRFHLVVADCELLDKCECTRQWRIADHKQPPPRLMAAIAYDRARGRAVLFGGHNGKQFLGDTWLWNGKGWQQADPTTSPPARNGAGMAYDSGRQVTVLYGGYSAGGVLTDTWEWDGEEWTQVPIGPGGLSASMGMCYDPVAGVVVRYGGDSGSGLGRDTYEYDGTAWTLISNASPPGYRGNHAMVYMPTLGRSIVFGGHAPGGTPLADTWTYDATTNQWAQLAIAGPSLRRLHAMAFDPSCQVIRLYGGSNPSDALAELWSFDGSAWTLDSEPLHKELGAREGSAMVFDIDRGQMILHGGRHKVAGKLSMGRYAWTYDCSKGTRRETKGGGIAQSSVGEAEFAPDDPIGVIVANLGSEAHDGFATSYGESKGLHLCFEPPLGQVLSAPKDAVEFDVVSATNNEVEDMQFIAFRGEGDGSGWNLGIDFTGLGASSYAVQVFDAGGLVGGQGGLGNGELSVSLDAEIGGLAAGIGAGGDFEQSIDVYGGTSVTIHVDGTPYSGNRIVFTPENASVATDYLSGTSLSTNAAETMTQCWPSLSFGEAAAMGVGEALLSGDEQGNTLVIEVPATFADPQESVAGVTLAWEPEGGCDDGVELGWEPLALAELSLGSLWSFQAGGVFDGLPHAALGTLELELIDKSTGNPTFQLSADYSDVGSTTQRIQVFEAGSLVAEFAGQATPFTLQSPTVPEGCGKELVDLDGSGTACFRVQWSTAGSLTLDGLTAAKTPVIVTGDELAVLAEAPTGAVTRLQSFGLRMSAGFPTLRVISLNGSSGTTDVEPTPALRFVVDRPYPNPFNPRVHIQFVNPRAGAVSVAVYDLAGRLVRKLLEDSRLAAGTHRLDWDGRDARGAMAASGVYLVRVRADGSERSVKATLLK